ncbi:CRISPR-associated protein Cas5 [Dissulfurispira thermophila]|uniref:CRISPR-associated protein Cas5 n=1 Tax=Dissulfurispira thermophila TaxID=2715679 RepID=A0A7G1H3U5_9BACT|nr:CRISPR-associated protein Cas5 [Dissulfurispira thermophila]BCB96811.1 CRISPR-associated protein Cas5 [Dissulfurispira thermophila]
MRAVRIKLYQNMVNYRRELSFGYVQTYPLPTPSMIKGMAHGLLNLDKYHNLKISIQGNYSSVVTNMQKVYKFDRDRASRPNNPYDVIVGNANKTAMHGVMFVDEIVDMELMLHISFDEDNLNEQLLEAVRRKTVVLGRNEDIAQVDFEGTNLVDILSSNNEYRLPYSIYLNPEICRNEQLEGTHYRLPFYYEPVSSFNDKRIFRYVDAVYIAKGNKIQYSDVIIDSDGNLVSFLSIKNGCLR